MKGVTDQKRLSAHALGIRDLIANSVSDILSEKIGEILCLDSSIKKSLCVM